jgi:hypothetical protein
MNANEGLKVRTHNFNKVWHTTLTSSKFHFKNRVSIYYHKESYTKVWTLLLYKRLVKYDA